ncbi:acyl-CoA thioesterase [Winogradskyella immobilis]|uniref:Thioesterase family protein n=1 Tax=Winogradskyella immobilis TaxID=2816852 RepID=A0ABS8EQF8_9FLAO|nr:acyl-CoA thioesterase [Winogradskyella immobilis]MCC1485463.1 thioesterase family protein [Winogradskyella immobilis]MCG0017555.1 thioesterase family protein [Winogradskyella immobilis]
MYKKQFEIRWSDVDPNGHLANSAYTNFMSHTRMSFFSKYGFSIANIKKENIGPVVFYEHMHYFKEAFINEDVTVTLEVSGLSEDGMFFMFEHNFYDAKGQNLAYCEIQGGWIDLTTRKLCGLPESLLELANKFPKSQNFKTLTKEDTRKHSVRPKHL